MVAQSFAFRSVGALTPRISYSPAVKEKNADGLAVPNIVPRLTVHLTGRKLIILRGFRRPRRADQAWDKADCSQKCPQKTQRWFDVTDDHREEYGPGNGAPGPIPT
jgi:hypothetical protein